MFLKYNELTKEQKKDVKKSIYRTWKDAFNGENDYSSFCEWFNEYIEFKEFELDKYGRISW